MGPACARQWTIMPVIFACAKSLSLHLYYYYFFLAALVSSREVADAQNGEPHFCNFFLSAIHRDNSLNKYFPFDGIERRVFFLLRCEQAFEKMKQFVRLIQL